MPCTAVSAACAVIGVERSERVEIERAAVHRLGDFFHRADFRRGEPESRQPFRARTADRGSLERVIGRGEAAPDRAGAGGRELLRHDNRGEPRKSTFASSQRRPARFGKDRRKPRVGFHQRGDNEVEVARRCE